MSVPNPKKLLFQTDLTESSTTDIEIAGTIREDSEGNVYRWVKNTHSAAFAVGDCVVYSGGTVRSQVTVPATASLANGAGVALAALASGSYGWIQCKGVGSVKVLQSNTSYSAYLQYLNLVNAVCYASVGQGTAQNLSAGTGPAVTLGNQIVPLASLDTASASATASLACAFNFRL